LSCYSGRQATELLFGRDRLGKPFLADQGGPANIMFNLAHSGSLVLVIVAAGRRVGVDLEQVRPFKDFFQVAEASFTAEECAFILSHAPGERERAFFRSWATKEAYIKGLGKGLSNLSKCSGAAILQGQSGCWLGDTDGRDSAPWWITDLELPDGYEGAAVIEGGHHLMLHWNWNSLLRSEYTAWNYCSSTLCPDRITAGPMTRATTDQESC